MAQDNDSFEALFSQSEKTSFKKLNPGQKVTATVVGIDGENLFLDVGAKSEGVAEASEFTDADGKLSVAIGDRIEVYCLKSGPAGQIFTARIGSGASATHLEEAWQNGVPVEGLVKAEIKGGFEITLSGNVRGFCPYSQMGLRRVENPAEYLDSRLNFLITRFEAGGRNIVVSARALQEEERRQKREALQQSLSEGQTVVGTISSIRPFGLFIDLGGVDGLVPISEIGWSRVENLSELYRTGQQVEAIIKGLDWENDRISLSIKATLQDPWEAAVAGLSAGTQLVGTVSRLAPFGAFVTLMPGVDGLIHVSKLGQGRKINHPREVLEAGQSIEVVLESIDLDGRKLSLAPADYTSPEENARKETEELQQYRSSKEQRKDKNELGSFGALLKSKLDQKKS